MSSDEQTTPRVFISYSHDSRDHKKWVAEFASRLVSNGVDVLLDQWDLGPGDDIPKFMEASVTAADRVLMICTEAYVHKANDGRGGVGYEAMIVTGELVGDLGTSKFIPVVRQTAKPAKLPKSVATRFFVDMSEEAESAEQFEVLLRELHKEPAVKKPPIGKNPFAVTPSGAEAPLSAQQPLQTTTPEASLVDPAAAYQEALDIARAGDFVRWRRLIRHAKANIPGELLSWRGKYEREAPKTEEELVSRTMEGVALFSPLMAVALAGVESGRDKFCNQTAVLDDLLFPPNWNRSGYTVVVNMPETAAFVYQAVHGALCLVTEQMPIAHNLAATIIESPHRTEPTELWRDHSIIGWPEALGRKATGAWDVALGLVERWPWLVHPFGSQEDYMAGLCAYYMSLNILEYVSMLASNSSEALEQGADRLTVPLCFLAADETIRRRAYRLFTADPAQVRRIWERKNVPAEKIRQHWPAWMRQCGGWINNVYRWGLWGRMTHEKLLDDVLGR